jgi:O-antigen/teichoic acid export membrane protein
MGMGTVVQKVLSTLTFFVLARYLLPADYGVIAVLFMVTSLFDMATTPGFGNALMQRNDDVEEYLDITWTFGVIKAVIVMIIVYLSAPVVAIFFHIEGSIDVLRWGSLLVFIPALGNSRQYYFFKHLDFRKVFYRDIVSRTAYAVCSIGWVVFISADVWALVAGNFALYTSGTLMSYVLYPHRQKFSFRFSKLRDLWWYSKWAFGQNILQYVLNNVDGVYIGRLLSPTLLGVFSKAKSLSGLIASPLLGIISKVAFPAYALVQDTFSKVEEGYMKSVDLIVMVTVPTALLFIAKGGFIIMTLLGQTWLQMVVPLKILSVIAIFSSLSFATRPIFDAIGRPDIGMKLRVFELVSMVVLMYTGIHFFGFVGALWGMLVAWVLIFGLSNYVLRGVVNMGFSKFTPTVVSIFGAVGVVLVVAIPTYLLGMADADSIILNIIWISALGILYIGSIWLIGGRYSHGGPRHTVEAVLREMIGDRLPWLMKYMR